RLPAETLRVQAGHDTSAASAGASHALSPESSAPRRPVPGMPRGRAAAYGMRGEQLSARRSPTMARDYNPGSARCKALESRQFTADQVDGALEATRHLLDVEALAVIGLVLRREPVQSRGDRALQRRQAEGKCGQLQIGRAHV